MLKKQIVILRNTRSFILFVFCVFRKYILSASEYEQIQTAYECYINYIQRLLRLGRFSPMDTLRMVAKMRIKLIIIQERKGLGR